MRILVMSDLHLDFPGGYRLPADLPDHDVVVLAGDIHQSPAHAVRWADAVFTRPVILVAGNHEFYSGRLDDRCFDGACAAMGTRMHFLARNSVDIDGIRFVGATLWTDWALHGDPKWAMHFAWSGMSDFRKIRKPGGRFTPTDALMQHRADLDALILGMTDASGPTVVVTHHVNRPGFAGGSNC